MNSLSNDVLSAPSEIPSQTESDLLSREFRSNMGQISRQSLIFFLGTLFTMAASYCVKIYVARVLGAELLGVYALGLTLVGLTQLVGMLGLHSTAGRYVAVYKATGKFDELRGFLTRSVATVSVLNLGFSVGLLFCGAWLAQHLYHSAQLSRYIPYFAVLAFVGALNIFYAQVLAGYKDVGKRTVITNFIGTSLTIALTVSLLMLGTGMRGYLWAQIISAVIVVLLLIAVAHKLTPKLARFSWRPLPAFDPEIKAFAAAAFGMNVLDFLAAQADKIMLGFFLNPRLVGIYVVASTVSAFIPIILQSVNQIFAPVIADLHAKGRTEVLEKLFQTLTKWVIALSFPLACVLTIFSLPVMRIFGPDFALGWKVLVIGALGQLVNCGVGSVGYLLLMSGNQRLLIRVQFVMAGISIAGNVFLIPVLGIVGAAIAAAVINVAGNLWNLRHVRSALGISPYNRSYYALLLPAGCTLAVVVALRYWAVLSANIWLSLLLALTLAYTTFCGVAIIFALNPDDRLIARGAWTQVSGSLQKLGVRL